MSASVASATSSLAQPKPSSNPSFPSSHMAYAMTDSILLGMLEPQLYQSMLVRASEMGESRIVVGVHYPLDIVASRAFVSYDLVNYLSNPAYIDNAATTGHAIDLPSLMGAAKGELDGLLSAAAVAANCGTSVATCATSSVNVNPYTPSATNAAVYAARTTYGLPTIAGGAKELTDRTGQDASILLATVYGGDSAAAKTLLSGLGMTGGMDGDLSTGSIRQIIANTESDPFSAFVGTQLSYWARINLDAAIGYFSGMTGTLTTADGDHLTIDATVASGGALDVAGRLTIDGAFALAAGGVLGVTLDGRVPETGYSQVEAGGAADLEGGLDVTLGHGFVLRGGDRFDLVHALGGLTDNISALTFDGDACSPLGDEIYRCAVGGHFDVFALPPTGASGTTDLELKLVSTPEPSSWTLIGLGFAGLSAFGRFVLGRGAARLA